MGARFFFFFFLHAKDFLKLMSSLAILKIRLSQENVNSFQMKVKAIIFEHFQKTRTNLLVEIILE